MDYERTCLDDTANTDVTRHSHVLLTLFRHSRSNVTVKIQTVYCMSSAERVSDSVTPGDDAVYSAMTASCFILASFLPTQTFCLISCFYTFFFASCFPALLQRFPSWHNFRFSTGMQSVHRRFSLPVPPRTFPTLLHPRSSPLLSVPPTTQAIVLPKRCIFLRVHL